MLSKNKIKYIRSLELKKKRKEEQVFVAEGHKLVGDLLGHFPCKLLIATSNWLKMNHSATANEIIEVTQEELSRASLQKTPQEVLAVFVQPSYDLNPEVIKSSLCLALDDVQDQGIWEPLSAWQTGLALNISSARQGQQMCIIQNRTGNHGGIGKSKSSLLFFTTAY